MWTSGTQRRHGAHRQHPEGQSEARYYAMLDDQNLAA
jgi:hypothetical protein